MARFLQRAPHTSCFFCQSSIAPTPPNPRSFLCPHCSCWNRYDENGDIISDDPAMYEETLNTRSFARRASPRKDRFLSSFRNTQFCDVCQSNQRLVMSLLASYLPPSENDSEYTKRLATYDAYKASIEARYPLVCVNCASTVDEEIRKKDTMARSNAFGRFLSKSKNIDKQRQITVSLEDKRKLQWQLRWWEVRGVLFWITLMTVLYVDSVAAGVNLPIPFRLHRPAYVAFLFLSFLWMAWDPSYAHLRRAQIQGRQVNVRGRNEYIVLQVVVWLFRLLTATFFPPDRIKSVESGGYEQHSIKLLYMFSCCFEIMVCLASYLILRLYEPPSVRLLDRSTSKVNPRSMTPTLVPIAGLQRRSATPSFIAHSTNAPTHSSHSSVSQTRECSPTLASSLQPSRTGSVVFGRPSLLFDNWVSSASYGNHSISTSVSNKNKDVDEDDDAMDWTPTTTAHNIPSHPGAEIKNQPHSIGVRREDTGLESLLAQANLAEEPSSGFASNPDTRARAWSWIWPGLLVTLSVLAACCAIWPSSISFLQKSSTYYDHHVAF